MATPQQIADQEYNKKILGKFDMACDNCKKLVNVYNSVKVGFQHDLLKHMKDLCIDCAGEQCNYYSTVKNSKLNLGNLDKEKKDCETALIRAERVKNYK